MRILIFLFLVLGSSHAANVMIDPNPKPKKVLKARITAYWAYPKQDPWTAKYQSSTGKRLVSGKSCAVDPRIIRYGSKVRIKGKTYIAKDTGTAVVARKASRGKLPVVDLFFATQKQAMAELGKIGRYAWVEVEN